MSGSSAAAEINNRPTPLRPSSDGGESLLETTRLAQIGTGQGDGQVGSTPGLNAPADAAQRLSQETNQIGMTGFFGGAARVALTTGDGIFHIPFGLGNAIAYDLEHPMEIVKAFGGSAAIAATLKTVLPEAGPVGKIAGLAMGAWFLASAAPGFINAYKTGLNANTWSELNTSGQQWGDAAGELGVNTGLGYAGYRLGAGLSGKILASERFDGFADFKQNGWNKATDLTKALLGLDTRIPTASSLGLQPNFVVDGDKVKLMDSVRADHPTDAVVGPVDANSEMNATVLLRGKASVLRMDRYIARMSEGKASSLTDENGAYQERFGASQESLDALKKFADEHNLAIAESDLRSGKVLLTGKTADFQNAFDVRLNQYQTDSGTVSGHSGAVSLPKELAPHVRAVLGIDERPVSAPSLRVQYKIAANGDIIDNDGKVINVTDGTLPDPANAQAVADFLKKGGYLAT
ncbi:MAG TPA: protease pro-enzyme activation domain-containing protein, partial [Trichormus sp.]